MKLYVSKKVKWKKKIKTVGKKLFLRLHNTVNQKQSITDIENIVPNLRYSQNQKKNFKKSSFIKFLKMNLISKKIQKKNQRLNCSNIVEKLKREESENNNKRLNIDKNKARNKLKIIETI